MKNNRYIIITPAKNEEKHINLTIQSVISQTIRPIQWIIVDDNSNDRTAEYAEEACRKYDWIIVVRMISKEKRAPGAKVIHAFNEGLKHIVHSYDYIVKLDADLQFSKDYFEKLLIEFDNNEKLGIAGGFCAEKKGVELVIERTPNYHVRGATKMYRVECFKDIGGIMPVMGWDGIDEIKAQMKGWKTWSFENLIILHLRPTGKESGGHRYAYLWGQSSYFMGYDPLFFILRALKNYKSHPYIIFSFIMIFGYLQSYVSRKPKIEDKDFIKFIRKFQRKRLLGLFKL